MAAAAPAPAFKLLVADRNPSVLATFVALDEKVRAAVEIVVATEGPLPRLEAVEPPVVGAQAIMRVLSRAVKGASLAPRNSDAAQVDQWLGLLNTELATAFADGARDPARLFALNNMLQPLVYLVAGKLTFVDLCFLDFLYPVLSRMTPAERSAVPCIVRYFDFIQHQQAILPGAPAARLPPMLDLVPSLVEWPVQPPFNAPSTGAPAGAAAEAPAKGAKKEKKEGAPEGEKKEADRKKEKKEKKEEAAAAPAPPPAPAPTAPAVATETASAAAPTPAPAPAPASVPSAPPATTDAPAPGVSAEAAAAQQARKEKKEKAKAAKEAASKDAAATAAPAPSAEPEFGKLDVRVGLIRNVIRHPEADGLYIETVDVGEAEPRTVVSGLVKYMPPEALLNTKVVLLCNLKPAKLKGVVSAAMVLAAHNEPGHNIVELVRPPASAKAGEVVRVEGIEPAPDAKLKEKTWPAAQAEMSTTAEFVVTYRGKPLMCADGPCRVQSLVNGSIA